MYEPTARRRISSMSRVCRTIIGLFLLSHTVYQMFKFLYIGPVLVLLVRFLGLGRFFGFYLIHVRYLNPAKLLCCDFLPNLDVKLRLK